MSKEKLLATICIPTYNGEDYIESLLQMVFKQKLARPYEVIVIDSGSTDKTLSIVKKFNKVNLHEIPNSEFGHGKTRNLAASMAKGEFIVYLSQDAVPAHERWLEFMIEPFMISDKVFCVFGKQVPRPNCDAPTKREVSGVFNGLGPDHSIMINRLNSLVTNYLTEPYLTFFSDVNSAVRKDYIINKIPFRDVKYSEDQLLGKDVIDNGYLKAYSPLGSVYHSNEYSLGDYFRRKYDEYRGMYEVLNVLPSSSRKGNIKAVIVNTIYDIPFILRDPHYSLKRKIFNLSTSWIRNINRQRAAYLLARKGHLDTTDNKYSLEGKGKAN